MKYRVYWSAQAELLLAELWLQSELRQLTRAAADRIDATLQRELETAGESREFGVRVLIVPPLTAHFEVKPDQRKVIRWKLRYFAIPSDR
jgi:hypothetical protein